MKKILKKLYRVSTQPLPEVSYFFSRAQGHPDIQLINVINSAVKTLDVAIYDITKNEIVSAIIDAKKRGVSVRLITDTQESTQYEASDLAVIKSAEIPIKINTHTGLMHLKVTIADNSTVTTGSYNYSRSATYNNDEVLVIIKSTAIAEDFTNQFNNMWNDNINYKLL